MLKNSVSSKVHPFALDLTYQEHLLGDFNNLLNNKENSDIVISLPFAFLGLTNLYLSLTFTVSDIDIYKAKLFKIEVIDKEDNTNLFHFSYRQATSEEKKEDQQEFDERIKKHKEEYKNAKGKTIFDDILIFQPFENPLEDYIEWSINTAKLKEYLTKLIKFYNTYHSNFKQDKNFLERMDQLAREESMQIIPSVFLSSIKNKMNPEDWTIYIEEILTKDIIEGKHAIGYYDYEPEDYYFPPPKKEEVFFSKAMKILKDQVALHDDDKNQTNIIEGCFDFSWKLLIQNISNIHYVSSIKEENLRVFNANINSPFINLLKDYHSLNIGSDSFINKYLKKFNIGKEIEIDYRYNYQLIFVAIVDFSGNKRHLVDFGYGIKQLIFLMIQITVLAEKNSFKKAAIDPDGDDYIKKAYHPSVLVIEEPETNLHPKWQSFLGELFLEANKIYNIQLIIETHSEYLIRKFQTLVASLAIRSNHIKIFYLRDYHSCSTTKKQIETIKIEKDGTIDYKTFDSGFFDESYNLDLSLLNYRRDNFIEEFNVLKTNQIDDHNKITLLEQKIDEFSNKSDLSTYEQIINSRFDTSKLNFNTIKYLVSGQSILNVIDSQSDFSPVIIQYGRAIESELKTIFQIVHSTKNWMLGIMIGSLEFYKLRDQTINPRCTSGQQSTLESQLTLKFDNPLNLKIDLLRSIKDVRNTAGHAGIVISKTDAETYIQEVNLFIDTWISEKIN